MAVHQSFREALGAASTRIEENIMSSMIGELKERSEMAVMELRDAYQTFFGVVLQAVTKPGVHGDTNYGMPSFLSGLSNPTPGWKELSSNWMKRKERATAPDAFNIYRGLTEGAHTGMRGRKNVGQHGPVKKGRGRSFKQYLETLSADRSAPGRIFGEPKIGYALIRPDGGKVSIFQNPKTPGAIGKIQQHQGGTGWFAKALDGTRLQAQIWAFPKLEGLLPREGENASEEVEDRVARFVGRKESGNKKQWMKIYGKRKGSHWRLRPLLTPVIQWYLQKEFESILKANLTK